MTGVGLPTMSGSVPFQAQEITVQRNAGARRHDRGAATFELAIVLPVLVSFTFGIIDFARMFNAEIQVSQAWSTRAPTPRSPQRLRCSSGWYVSSPTANSLLPGSPPCSGGDRCVSGWFVKKLRPCRR